GAYVVFTVSDSGHGMSDEVMAQIFEPFFTTKEIGKGTGLGLSTVQGIVKSHDGFLEVTSQAGQGTRFKVFLPAAKDGLSLRTEVTSATLPKGHGEQILIVDDEHAVLEMTVEALETFGYRPLAA